jgi:hypothetical protein
MQSVTFLIHGSGGLRTNLKYKDLNRRPCSSRSDQHEMSNRQSKAHNTVQVLPVKNQIKSSLYLITYINSRTQRTRRPIRAHEAWKNSAVTPKTLANGCLWSSAMKLFTLCTYIKEDKKLIKSTAIHSLTIQLLLHS